MNTKKTSKKDRIGFARFLQQKGMVAQTIARHEREVNKYAGWLSKKGKTPDNAVKKDLLDYLKHVKESRKLCNATQNGILQKLKNHYAFLTKEYRINDITGFIKIRGTNRRHLTPLFTPDELDLLCDAYYYHTREYGPTAKEIRFYPDQTTLLQGYYIALTLMAYQALQLKEIESLSPDDFDLRKATVSIRPSRKGAGRTLALDPCQIGVLIPYFAKATPIMPNRNHFEKLSNTLKTLSPKFKDFRQVRASKITHWLKLHGLRKAQHLAGHKSITSTEKYLAGDFETLQNDLDNFHPLNGEAP